MLRHAFAVATALVGHLHQGVRVPCKLRLTWAPSSAADEADLCSNFRGHNPCGALCRLFLAHTTPAKSPLANKELAKMGLAAEIATKIRNNCLRSVNFLSWSVRCHKAFIPHPETPRMNGIGERRSAPPGF